MKIPPILKIGAHYVDVVITDTPLQLDGCESDALGTARYATNRIEIRSVSPEGDAVPESVIADTLLHEILHLASCTYGLDLEESQVMGVSGALLGIIRDNGLDFRWGGDMGQKKQSKKKKKQPVAVPKSGKKKGK